LEEMSTAPTRRPRELLKVDGIIHEPERLMILTALYPLPKMACLRLHREWKFKQGYPRCRLSPVMFCPQCGVEYRPGFTHCTDCDVDLVHELPLARTDAFESHQGASPGEDEGDPFCAFWQGDDARLHVELCTVLDEAGIPHKTVRREDHLFNLKNFPAFQIGVPFSLFEKAENAVKDAYEMDSSGPDAVQALNPPALIPEGSRAIRKLPESLTPSKEENIPGPPDVGEEVSVDGELEWQGDGIEVWSGHEDSLGDILVASLRENKIDVHRSNSSGRESLLVRSRDEARAREIVKQVVEGVPPE